MNSQIYYVPGIGPIVTDANTPADMLVGLLSQEEWEKIQPKPQEPKEAKENEIISKANQARTKLIRQYSSIEEQTWPEQEAGARAITGLVNGGQSSRAWFILQDEEQTNKAKTFVADLAKLAGVSPQQYAERILKNASNYTEKSKQILYQEIALKAQLNAADTIEKIEAINVFYPE